MGEGDVADAFLDEVFEGRFGCANGQRAAVLHAEGKRQHAAPGKRFDIRRAGGEGELGRMIPRQRLDMADLGIGQCFRLALLGHPGGGVDGHEGDVQAAALGAWVVELAIRGAGAKIGWLAVVAVRGVDVGIDDQQALGECLRFGAGWRDGGRRVAGFAGVWGAGRQRCQRRAYSDRRPHCAVTFVAVGGQVKAGAWREWLVDLQRRA